MRHLIPALLFFIAACATTNYENFGQLEKGMDKDQVLHLVGNPKRTDRTNSIEKWSYRYFTGDNQEVENLKFVKFSNGKVIEFGNDTEETERLSDLSKSAERKEAKRKKKQAVDKKVEEAYQK